MKIYLLLFILLVSSLVDAQNANNLNTVESSDLAINELMASNDTTTADQDGEYDDWVEFYNNGTSTIDLSGYFLSDDASNLALWTFPDGTTLEPDSYLIVWADNDQQAGLHANFKLSASGDAVILSDTDTMIVDAVFFLEQTTDISYARVPNGTGEFQFSAPTFEANNDAPTDCTNMGGDADNDGICADVDCDDDNPAVGEMQTAGTTCDDEDITTNDDVIQADGCTCAGTPLPPSDLVINELMAVNDTTVADQDGEFDDWIELYNNGTSTIDLSGYFLSDDPSDPALWTFPDGTTLAPDDYLIIWADDQEQAGLHANFKLSATGESLILSNANAVMLDAVDYPEQTSDIAYARVPNGTGDFQLTMATFDSENSTPTNTVNPGFDQNALSIFPNPASNNLTISSVQQLAKISIFMENGQKIKEYFPSAQETVIDLDDYLNGLYFVRVISEGGGVVTKKVIIMK